MSRKTLLSSLLVLALAVIAAAPAWAAKDYHAERFDVQFELQPDGSALVTETVVFRFDGGPFTYAFRDIEATGTDGLAFVEAGMDGEERPPGTRAGQVEVTGSDPLRVKWHFAPASDTAHEFVVRYRVDGVVRKLAADTIHWRAIPQDHDYPIERSTITFTYPPAARPIDQPVLSRDFEAVPLSNGIQLTTTDIPRNQDVILTARFAAGTAAASAPQWQIRQQQAEAAAARALPIGLLAFVVTLLLGGLGLFVYARAQSGRAVRREAIPTDATAWDTPPDDAAPAIAAKLTRHSQAQGVMGTLFDLAQRGVLEVREDRGWLGTKKFTLELKAAAAPLSAHEQGLLSAVFKPGETTVDMAALPGRLARQRRAFDEPVEQELIDRGWLDPDRKRQRRNIGVLGGLLMLAALGLFVLGAVAGMAAGVDQAPVWAAFSGMAAGGFVVSIGVLIYCAAFSPLTPDGEAEAARWQSFARHLKQASRKRQAVYASDDFERYLPWAAAFGLGGAWAKHFQRSGGAPLPVWFHARPGSDGDFSALVAVMSAADTAGAGAAGGAGGASGGGSSGAG